MIAPSDLLNLLQWLSPAFPVSGYAHSHGLETAIAEGRVSDAETLHAWIAAVLSHGAGPLDCWALRAVLGGAATGAVAEVLRARAGSAERWSETLAQGAAFGATQAAMGRPPHDALPFPAAFAHRARGIAPEAACAAWLHAIAGQLVSVAVRLVPLGQSAGQNVLARLHPRILVEAATPRPDPPGGFAPLAELDAMAHETLQPRMFRT